MSDDIQAVAAAAARMGLDAMGVTFDMFTDGSARGEILTRSGRVVRFRQLNTEWMFTEEGGREIGRTPLAA